MNKVILSGRLTRDPEITYGKSDKEELPIARYSIAVQRNADEADFISCTAFRRAAEFAEDYLKKGTKVIICGHLQTGSYINKENNKVYTTDVIIESQEFAESKKAAAEAEEPKSKKYSKGR